MPASYALSDVTIETIERGPAFLGLGRIACGGTPLRHGRRPLFVDIRSPDAIAFEDYRLAAVAARPEEITLDFTMHARPGGPMVWMVHEVRSRVNTADWSRPPELAADTSLRLTLRAVERVFGGRTAAGFSYQYHYQSANVPIAQITDRGTWEPGGSALGCQFWMRHSTVPPLTRFESPAQHYSTEWYLPSAANPNVFQFFPLQTCLQGFTFTVAPQGVLVTWATEVAHIRSLVEKPRGSEEIVHWHEHCGDLAHSFATAPVEVLWLPGRFDRTTLINLYEAVREHVWGALHTQIGMRQERVTTYGVIEQWDDADIDHYTDHGVPRLIEAGCKTIMLANHFANNMNTYGVGNMCCTLDYRVAETVGEERLRRLCDAARAGGAEVEMWGNTALSTLALILDSRNGRPKRIDFPPRAGSIMEALERAEAPWVRTPSNAIEADHYTPVFAVLNLREPAVRAYWHARWQEAHDRIGLRGIFLDSSFNLSSDKFHYCYNPAHVQQGATMDQTDLLGQARPAEEPPPQILSQYRAHLDLMVEMQRYGYRYCGEDTGVFGVSRAGPSVVRRLDNLFMWVECLADFDVPALQRAGADPDDIFFRGLAYRMMWKLFWLPATGDLSFNYGEVRGDFDRPAPWHLRLLRIFAQVNDAMRQREVLPDEAGVRYRSGDTQVIWAFGDLALPLGAPAHVHDLVADERAVADRLAAARHHVYLITAA
jgi:hypothetical protein